MKISLSVGGKIREARVAAGLSQGKLAEKTGRLCRQVISRIELGDRAATVEELIWIAEVLGLKVEDLADKSIAKTNSIRPGEEVTTTGGAVKRARQLARMSQVDLARLAGVSPQTIKLIEDNYSSGSLSTLNGIAKVFGKTIDELIHLPEPAAKKAVPPEVEVAEPPKKEEFGDLVYRRRIELGLNQYQLAIASKVSRNYLSEIERGYKANLSWDIRQRLSKVLGITEDEELKPMPPGLATFAESSNLNDEEVSMLSKVNYKGMQPTNAEGWKLLYKAIRVAIAD